MRQRLRAEIQGAVQGVGFRPFVYRLASDLDLTGWVINDTGGVVIEVEGSDAQLAQFAESLTSDKPPRAVIQTVDLVWLDPVGYVGFEIRHSDDQGAKTVNILPDIATCPECLADIQDAANRRFHYPFTNCTNCGPRFTIIEALPYDRPNTTMRVFEMCPACAAEYADPLNRRFHAQPNACPNCGPCVALLVPEDDAGRWASASSAVDAIRGAAAALRRGQIVAAKGLGGFHLMVDARNSDAVARLRERKPRRDKPFALMVRDLQQAYELCDVSPEAEALLSSPEAPIVLLPARGDTAVAPNVAPETAMLGIMLPYTPLHHLLLRETGFPIVATSGNLTDEPICIDNDDAIARLGHIADAFLVHDRPIARHVDDSVAWLPDGAPRLLRRARGYAPLPVLLPQPVPTVLAVGAHLKNTVALSIGRQSFVSQHIGDLETLEALNAFERVIADFLRLYEVEPTAIAHDMHPDYISTQWAQRITAEGPRALGVKRVAVQHHHAHLVACLADAGIEGPALGVTWDGAGYGPDGVIWGGEFLLGDASAYRRVAHLRPFRLPGGDAAVRQPRRVALALLWETYGDVALELDLSLGLSRTPAEHRVLNDMLRRGVSSPLTTSAGRLFDGVAALVGLHREVTFEGQAAMALENLADQSVRDAYHIDFVTPGDDAPIILDWRPMIEAIVADVRTGTSPSVIAARFHNSLVAGAVRVASLIGAPRVALTGGCFQNRLLVQRMAQALAHQGMTVVQHRQVPPNDGGISLGQVAIAAAQLAQAS
ncbi:MAG: carbamoyltransferase HypF [Anaerolineae bacterium]